MKKTILFFTGLCAICALLFTACSKDNNTKPDIDDTEEPKDQGTAEQLQKDIIGKWTIDGNGLNIMASTAQSKSLKASASNRMASTKIASTNTMSTSTTSAFIEFLADGTFIILDSNGNVSIGDYTAKDGQTIDLSGFGSIKDIKFADGNIDCVIHYTQSDSPKTLNIKAKKAVQISASDRTTLLCRTWQVERIENKWSYSNWNEQTNDYDKVWEHYIWENGLWTGDTEGLVEFNKFIVRFSVSGTYLAQIYDKQGKLIEATVEYWKWHPNDNNKFISWLPEDAEPTNDYADHEVNVLQLTQSLFEIKSYGDEGEFLHMTFKAVN